MINLSRPSFGTLKTVLYKHHNKRKYQILRSSTFLKTKVSGGTKRAILGLTVPRRYFFCGSFMFLFCLMFAMSLCASVYLCFVVTYWEKADL